MYLVMGITGKVGGATAKHLLAQGKKVRALVRSREKAASWTEQGVELVEGDWNDGASIAKALEGVEAAYVMMPPVMTPSRDFKEAKAVIAAYKEAFKKTVPRRLVALSSIGSEKTSKLGSITSSSLMEQAFRQLPFPVAFIRAGGFYENFLYGLQFGQGGTLPVFYDPTSKQTLMVATDAIGSEAAKLLTGSAWTGLRTIELGSKMSADEVASQLGQVLGRDVKAQSVPRDQWAGIMEQMGMPKGQTWAFEEMFDSLNSGWISYGVEGTESVEGTTTARDVFAAAQKAAKETVRV
jgi:uncharacterized protein YbjT (DUF2867 family)